MLFIVQLILAVIGSIRGHGFAPWTVIVTLLFVGLFGMPLLGWNLVFFLDIVGTIVLLAFAVVKPEPKPVAQT